MPEKKQTVEPVAKKFWESKKLSQMSKSEWESLCDGCGRCCLNKIEYEDTEGIFFTNVACKLLDSDSCRCKNYKNRHKQIPDCVSLTPGNIEELDYMPSTCAYRLLANNRPLPGWHPLITGDSESVHKAGISVRGKTVSEEFFTDEDLEDNLIDWIKTELI